VDIGRADTGQRQCSDTPANPKFPADTPTRLCSLTESEYDDYWFHRLHRTVSEEAKGGAQWRSDDELVRVISLSDEWAVEAPPIERKSHGDTGDEETTHIHIIEYEMVAEYNLSRREAYRIADSYIRGERELTDDPCRADKEGNRAGPQQTLSNFGSV
jgi:hypothetical protein